MNDLGFRLAPQPPGWITDPHPQAVFQSPADAFAQNFPRFSQNWVFNVDNVDVVFYWDVDVSEMRVELEGIVISQVPNVNFDDVDVALLQCGSAFALALNS